MREGLKITICSPEGMTEVRCYNFPFYIGRSMECQVRLRGAGFSRKHLEVRVVNGQIVVKNVTETNTSQINRSLMPFRQDVIYKERSEIRFSRVKDTFIVIEKCTEEENEHRPLSPPPEDPGASRFAFNTEDETFGGYNIEEFRKQNPPTPAASGPSGPPPGQPTPPPNYGNAAPNLNNVPLTGTMPGAKPGANPVATPAPSAGPATDAEYLRLQEEKRKLMEAENEQLKEQIVRKMRIEAEEEGWRIKQQALAEAEMIKQQGLNEAGQLHEKARIEASEQLMHVKNEIARRKEEFNKEVGEHTTRMNSEKKNWLEEKEALRKKIFDHEDEIKRLAENLRQAQLDEVKAKEDAEKAAHNFKLQEAKNKELLAEYDRVKEQITIDKDQHESIQGEWEERLNKQMASFENNERLQREKIENLKIEWAQLDDKIKKMAQMESEYQEAKSNLESIQRQVSHTDNELEKKMTSLREAERSIENSSQEVKLNQRSIEELKEKIDLLKHEKLDLEQKKGDLAHFIEGERSAALQETYKHKAKVEKEISQLKQLASQKIEEEKRATDEFCIKLKQDAQNQQNKIIADANKQVEIIHSSRSQEIVKRERDLLEKENKIAEKEKSLVRMILNRDERSKKQAKVMVEQATTEAERLVSTAKQQADSLTNSIEQEVNSKREALVKEIDAERSRHKADLESQKRTQKQEVEEKKEKLKAEADSLADKLVEEGNIFKREIEKQFKSNVNAMAADVAEGTAHLMSNILKEKMGMKVNTLDLRKYRDEVKKVVMGVITPEEKPSEVQVLLRNARVPNSVKKYWAKVIGAVALGVSITLIFHLNKGLMPAIKNKLSNTFGADNAASDIFVKKIEEARRNKPKFNPQKTKLFKYGYLDNVLYTENYLEVISNKKYYQKWVESLNRLLLNEMELSDQSVVKIVTTESNMHLKLINATSKIRLEHLEKDISEAGDIEREHLEKIQAILKSPRNFQKFMDYRDKFYKEFTSGN